MWLLFYLVIIAVGPFLVFFLARAQGFEEF